MNKGFCVGLVVWLLSGVVFAGEQPAAKGKVASVVLYRGQALVTRSVPFEAPAGAVQLLVTELPQSVVPDSLFANAGEGIQIRAVRYRTFAVEKAPQDEVRKLDDHIAEVEKAMRQNAQSQQLVAQQQAYINNLESFTAPTAQVEMTKGVLNADTLMKVTTMIFERREALSKQSLALQEEQRSLRERQTLLQRRRAELTRDRSKTMREAIVFLDKAAAGAASIELSYLVGNATWEPSYNLKAAGDMKAVNVEYAALAQQMSGEDWDGVALTLSTAAARMVATGPTLAPMWLTLTRTPPGRQISDVESRMKDTQKKLLDTREQMQRSVGQQGQVESQWEMNKAAESSQNLELLSNSEDIHILRRMRTETSAGLSVNYKLPGKVSLASRQESQMVEIARVTLPAKFYYEAVPLLTEQVHRYAELTNTSELSLLQGRSHMYLDGDFVGRGLMSMVARGQKLTVGFGVEPQLRAWREFVSKDERIQGGNRNIKTHYRLVLDNYADRDIDVRVLDRIPISKEDIRVTLGELKDPLSTDAEYLRAFRPRGILRWDVSVKAKSAATTARIIEYSYTLEFDRNLHIGSEPAPAASPAAKQEMQDMMRY